MRRRFAPLLLLALGLAAPALADDSDGPPAAPPRAYDRGESLPLSLRAERGAGERALVMATTGFDGARDAATFEVAAELHLWGPIWLRGGAAYLSSGDTLKPTVSALVELFHAGPVAGTAALFYKPEGLTEPEGEIEGVLAFGLRLDVATIVGNLAYGQDGEGNERDGEVRLGGTVRVGRGFFVGADGRFRFSIGTTKAGEPDYDLVAGPLATLVAWDTAFTAQAGVSMVKVGETKTGPTALVGVSRVF
jgi:hypothetical protein